MIYLTSDWHFNHQKTFIYEPRGFSSPEEMNEIIIQNHNSIVRPDDDVYCLGDCVLGGAEKLNHGLSLIMRLNGNLHIVRGNHDSINKCKHYNQLFNIVELENAIYLNYKKYNFYLSHYPTITSNFDYDKPLKARLLNLCGHSHTTNKWNDIDKGYIYHCELDAHNIMPISIEEIIEDFKGFF